VQTDVEASTQRQTNETNNTQITNEIERKTGGKFGFWLIAVIFILPFVCLFLKKLIKNLLNPF
jgi:hypothetical protein